MHVVLQHVRDRDSVKKQQANYAKDRPIAVGDAVILEKKRVPALGTR